MEWSILFVLSCLLLAECGVSAGGRRMSRLENTVRDLVREIKELKTKSGSAQLAGATLDALQVESRALSQFDRQMRSLQDSLDQLARRKDRQVETSQSLRRDLDQLKKEFELKKSREVSGSDQNASSENVIKTVQWLTNSLTELRSEIDQINSNLNLTGYMQHSDDVNKQIGFITEGVHQLRHQWTAESAERQRLAAEVLEMRLDLNNSDEKHQRCLKDLGHLTMEVQSFKADWNLSSSGRPPSPASIHPHRYTRQKFEELKAALDSIRNHQQQLEAKVNRILASPPLQKRLDQLTENYAELQAKVEVNSAVLAKMEASQGSLHQNVELLVDQNDFQAQEMLLALDRLQFNVTQVQILCDQVLQHQDISDDKLTRIAADVELIEGEVEKDHVALLALQSRAMNDTLQKCKEETQEQIYNMEIKLLQQQVEDLKIQTDALNKSRTLIPLSSSESSEEEDSCGIHC